MRTDIRGRGHGPQQPAPRPGRIAAIIWLWTIALAASASGQGLFEGDAKTQVRVISFDVTGSSPIREQDLRKELRLTGQGSNRGLRNFFDFIPLVEPVGDHPLDPIELQRDVARLRRFYARSGFRAAAVQYHLTQVEGENSVDVEFRIVEGEPLRIGHIDVQVNDSGAAHTADSGEISPDRLLDVSGLRTGDRLEEERIIRARDRLLRHLHDAGHPAAVMDILETGGQGDAKVGLLIRARPGDRAVVSTIRIEGERDVRDAVILRELPFAEGDAYRARDLAEGRRELSTLGVFRQAMVEPVVEEFREGALPVRIRLVEDLPRLVTGDAGYDSRGGVTAQVQWQHRNFTGDARSLNISARGQTGLLSLEDLPEILYRGTVSLRQPWVFSRKVSAVVTPFVEYRDDYRDRSRAWGGGLAFIGQLSELQTISLQYDISWRTLLTSRYGEYAEGRIDILTLLSQVARGEEVQRATVRLSGTLGELDDIANPTLGYSVRPAFEITLPSGFNSIEYGRVDLAGSLFLPVFSGIVLALRGSAGRIYPYGKGLPGEGQDTLGAFLAFRDVAFTAGGSSDVRGWSSALLGPKFPDTRAVISGTDTSFSTEAYTPITGLARVSFSVELRTPLPLLGSSWGGVVMLDGGKVWTPDSRFNLAEDPYRQQIFFYSLGSAIEYRTPVGALRFTVGYKLNPSILDVRPAEDVLTAVLNDTPVEDIQPRTSYRWQTHFSLQVGF